MDKRALSLQMNIAVPASEKEVAEKASKYFQQVNTVATNLSDYLDKIYIPFQKHDNLDMKEIEKYRKTFRDYRDQVVKKFEHIVKLSGEGIDLMNNFIVDTTIKELIDSFNDMIRELKKYIDIFVSIFSDFSSQEFRQNLLGTIDSIKRQINQIKQLVNDRILDHIESNILAKNWAADISETSDGPKQERVPLVIQLFRERQKALAQGG